MDPVGGDLFVVGSTQQSQQSGKNEQKLSGNHQNVHEPHQTVLHFLSKKALILSSNSGRQGVSVLMKVKWTLKNTFLKCCHV